MAKGQHQFLYLASALFVPFLTLIEPKWLTLSGVGPSWAVLWLLPWAIETGSGSGMIAGLFLGLILDGISLENITQIPALVGLGFWWGILGRRGLKIESALSLGLLAWIGSVLNGLSVLTQILLVKLISDFSSSLLLFWGIHTFLSQAILTGLLAPLVCSLFLLWFRQGTTNSV